jgi:hypothetical protein
VFFAKSAELHENKRVEFLGDAKKCKRVRKSVKRKGIVGSGWRVVKERDPPTPITYMIVKRKDLQNGQFVND